MLNLIIYVTNYVKTLTINHTDLKGQKNKKNKFNIEKNHIMKTIFK